MADASQTTETNQQSASMWAFAALHAGWGRDARNRNKNALAAYHEGKAFAYEHCARMIDGTDAS